MKNGSQHVVYAERAKFESPGNPLIAEALWGPQARQGEGAALEAGRAYPGKQAMNHLHVGKRESGRWERPLRGKTRTGRMGPFAFGPRSSILDTRPKGTVALRPRHPEQKQDQRGCRQRNYDHHVHPGPPLLLPPSLSWMQLCVASPSRELEVAMHELQRVLERQVRELACGVLSQSIRPGARSLGGSANSGLRT